MVEKCTFDIFSHSQFGKRWITNESESKKINKNDLIPSGWRLGRK